MNIFEKRGAVRMHPLPGGAGLVSSHKKNIDPVMTLAYCTIELPNNEVSDTTDVDSSNTAHYIIINFIKRANRKK
jgi:hypothetical protein